MAYASKTLKSIEKNYFTMDKKGLAVVWAVKQFKPYVMDINFKITTDHNASKAL